MRNRRMPGARVWSRILPILLAAMATVGCGSTGPGMAQVTGKVTYKGNPVPKGTITFQSTTPDGRNATGMIDPEGNYRLQTENPGDGALVGDYVVVIAARDNPVLDYIPKKPAPPKFLAPAKYENPNTSGLKETVKDGSNSINFDLKD